jgi:hypothetical protein
VSAEPDDFYEDDEPIEDIHAIVESGEWSLTAPPMPAGAVILTAPSTWGNDPGVRRIVAIAHLEEGTWWTMFDVEGDHYSATDESFDGLYSRTHSLLEWAREGEPFTLILVKEPPAGMVVT